MRIASRCLLAAALLAPLTALADPPQKPQAPLAKDIAGPVTLDRVVARWSSPETGGAAQPQFVFERELAFEARIEALADPDPDGSAYRDRHVRAALDWHIAETLLAALPILPAPDVKAVTRYVNEARIALNQRAGGSKKLAEAAKAEGIIDDEIEAMLKRKARANLYLHKMVTPMLEPTEIELRDLHRSGTTPFKGMSFDKAREDLRLFYIRRMTFAAAQDYYQNARSRITVNIIKR